MVVLASSASALEKLDVCDGKLEGCSSQRAPVELRVPELSPGLEFATVLQWRKQEGEPVRTGEPLLEVEADKVTYEVESPSTGTLASIAAVAGDELRVGDLLAVIEPV
jgi:pyruvate/2-oxoglutarate dehydrogenase complex dihydrolipoamide acyltransferase (E2) component